MINDNRIDLHNLLRFFRQWSWSSAAEDNHELVSGTIGMGKSYWILYRILQSLERDTPLTYIDPKGDTYRNLLAFLSGTREGQRLYDKLRHRILFLNPVSPSGQIVGFNAMEPIAGFDHAQPDRIALLANSITSHIRRQSGFEIGEANRMQNIMAAAIGTLAQGHGYSLAEIPLLFVQTYGTAKGRRCADAFNPFVNSLLPQVNHIGTLSFWHDQWTNWPTVARREWVQSTEGRIFQYLFDERLLYTVCTIENSRLNFRRLVDEGYWLFVNLPYPLLSDTLTTLLGNLLITKIFYACMQRTPGARPYRLILDEARFFNSGPLDMLLETSRAYNLWLTVVVQSLTQMARAREGYLDHTLIDTVVGNVRHWFVFHNATDAQLLAQLVFPLTGQNVIGTRQSGDNEYQSIVAEKNENERRFTDLGHRQMIVWDRLKSRRTQIRRTPPLSIGEPEQARLDMFEAQHLQLTGVPATQIRTEIVERQKRIRQMLLGNQANETESPPEYGGPL